MADRAVRQARHDKDGDVTALGSGEPHEHWSPRSKGDVINDIELGLHTYYVPWKIAGRTEVRVVQGPYGKYLRTDRDNTERNNLDDLPEC